MAKKYVMLYYDYLEAIEPLSDPERGRLLTAVLKYSKTGEAEKLCGNERFIFPIIKAQIDRDAKAYEEKCKIASENGKLGGRPRREKLQPATHKQKLFPESQKSQEEDKEKEEENDNDKKIPELSLMLNDKTQYEISKKQLIEWAGLYPAVDIMQQLRNMKGWILANPTKAKTRQGIMRFINGWLSREQNKGPAAAEDFNGSQKSPKPKNKFKNYEAQERDWDEIDKLELERMRKNAK